MSKLLLLNFNNYYNRIVKMAPQDGDYKAAVGEGNWWEYSDINFFQNDGVETTQTINFTSASPAPEGVPDYLVVYDDNGNRKSRWFVLECKHNRKNQYVLSLRRDLFVDYHDEIMSSKVYVEKGCVPFSKTADNPDPALYLDEDIEVNRIPGTMHYITQGNELKYYAVIYIADDGNEYKVQTEIPPANPGDTPQIFTWCTFPSNRQPSGYKNPYTCYYWECIGAFGADIAIIISNALSGSGALYDVQLLPYAPPHASSGDIPFQFNRTLLRADSCDFSFDKTIDLGLMSIGSHDASDAKVANQCERLRISSPGEASSFEYTPFKAGAYKTGGNIFTVKCTYRPINPYIHVVPKNFSNLYWQTFNKDQRGLIVSGDFSLPTTTDQWQTYMINNKNFINSFNREVETIELQNKWGLATDIASAVGGAVSGATMGGALGGVGGAIAGGVGSAIAGAVGVVGNQQLREDALDLKKDQFRYSLQNIRALPVLLNRTSSYVIDSQVCPYVQLYSCTATEKQAVRDKIKWNGMKVGRIGTFQTYWGYLETYAMYMKCKLIRINIKDDYHVISEIGKELDKGFYIT